jgi:hypothetical protein
MPRSRVLAVARRHGAGYTPALRIVSLLLLAGGVLATTTAAGSAGGGSSLHSAAWAAPAGAVPGAPASRQPARRLAAGSRRRPASDRRHRRPTGAWIPTGTGIWIYQWSHTDGGNAVRVVRQARAVGLSTLYVRTGSSWDGFTGPAVLRRLLRAAYDTPVSVVAWDFPSLANPVADARRLADAAWFQRWNPHVAHVRAVAPDIEMPPEGTDLTTWRVLTYLRWLRRLLPHGVSILATVPWPSPQQVGYYPYRLVAEFSDALEPMAYWYTYNPAWVTQRSLQVLHRLRRPVIPIGQGYDNRVDQPGLPPSDLGSELATFVRTAHRFGAPGISLWAWQDAGPLQWRTLVHAHRDFPVRPR